MYILNIARAIRKMLVNEISDFIFKNYYKRIGFSKENSYYSMILIALYIVIQKKEKFF